MRSLDDSMSDGDVDNVLLRDGNEDCDEEREEVEGEYVDENNNGRQNYSGGRDPPVSRNDEDDDDIVDVDEQIMHHAVNVNVLREQSSSNNNMNIMHEQSSNNNNKMTPPSSLHARPKKQIDIYPAESDMSSIFTHSSSYSSATTDQYSEAGDENGSNYALSVVTEEHNDQDYDDANGPTPLRTNDREGTMGRHSVVRQSNSSHNTLHGGPPGYSDQQQQYTYNDHNEDLPCSHFHKWHSHQQNQHQHSSSLTMSTREDELPPTPSGSPSYSEPSSTYDANDSNSNIQQLPPSIQHSNSNWSGWHPFGDNSLGSDSVKIVNNMKGNSRGFSFGATPRDPPTRRGLTVKTFFGGDGGNNINKQQQQVVGSTDGQRRQGGGNNEEEDIETQTPQGYVGFDKVSRKRSRCRKNLMAFAILLLVIGIIVVVSIIVPSKANKQADPSKKQAGDDDKVAPITNPCIPLQIVMSSTDANANDINAWSLTRTGNNDNVIAIKSEDDLPELYVTKVGGKEDNNNGVQEYTYKKCVQPGVYTFSISDSSGNGLGTEGSGKSGYYITANDVTLGVSSFFFDEEKMTFTLPLVKDDDDKQDKDDTVCTDDFFLAIKTDGNPSQTNWNVINNDTQEQVLEGGPYDLPYTVYTHRACLPNGSYTFNMLDGGEDGVCCDDGKGFFVLQKDGKTIVNSDGEFGSEKSVVFELGDEEV